MQNFTDALIDSCLVEENVNQELKEWVDTPTFESINSGDIIIAKIYQYGTRDHSARPVLVINRSDNEVYGFYITSSNANENMDFYKVPISDLNGTGLNRACYANLSQEVNIKPQFISGPNPVIGHINRVDLDKIIEHLVDINCVRSYPFKYNLKAVINSLKHIQ